MHSIMVRRVDGTFKGSARALALDISTPTDAWSIAESIASSYDEHGIDRNALVFWFRNAAGLYHIWAEQTRADSHATPCPGKAGTSRCEDHHTFPPAPGRGTKGFSRHAA